MEIPEVQKQIKKIADNNVSSASTISREVCECLDNFTGLVLEDARGLSAKSYFFELMDIGKQLVVAQRTMAPVFNAVNEIISLTHKELVKLDSELGPEEKRQLRYLCTYTQSSARKYILSSQLAIEAIASSYELVLHDQPAVMTLSASSAVEALLMQAHNEGLTFRVIVPESRPMNEGRTMAQRLVRAGIDTTLIADGAMFQLLFECSAILIGADRITPTGVMNKIGSFGLALAAKELGLPFYCISEKTKFIPDFMGVHELLVQHPTEELYPANEQNKSSEKLVVKNIYFDFTPIKYVTNFLTEDGLMTADQVRKHIETMELVLVPELVGAVTAFR